MVYSNKVPLDEWITPLLPAPTSGEKEVSPTWFDAEAAELVTVQLRAALFLQMPNDSDTALHKGLEMVFSEAAEADDSKMLFYFLKGGDKV